MATIHLDEVPQPAALLDHRGVLMQVNGRWRAVVAECADPVVETGQPYAARFTDDPRARVATALPRLLDGHADVVAVDHPWHAVGHHRWFRMHAERISDDRVLAVHQSITRELWLASTLERQPGAMLELDRDLRLVRATPGWLDLVGSSLVAELDRGWRRHVHRTDRPALDEALALAARQGERVTVEVRVRTDSGWSDQRVHLVAHEVDDVRVGVLGFIDDITHDLQVRTSLELRAATDELTGLVNRGMFLEHLRVALAAAPRTPTWTAVLFADLDDFKRVNDELGHLAGDLVLAEVARRLVEAVRPEDVVARFGGDEFVVLLQRLDRPERVADLVERVIRSLLEPVRISGGREVRVHLSVGAAVADEGESAQDVLERADEEMYRRKQRTATPWDGPRFIDVRTGAQRNRKGAVPGPAR